MLVDMETFVVIKQLLFVNLKTLLFASIRRRQYLIVACSTACNSVDFKYYEDVSDEYRDQEGTLLPLWKFLRERQ